MNQNARKTAQTSVEKDCYKLLNNSNFGNDCRNNFGNCKLDLLDDGMEEIKYIKKFTSILSDQQLFEFFALDLLKEQTLEDYNEKIPKIDESDPYYFSYREYLSQKLEEDLEAIEQISKNKRKRKN